MHHLSILRNISSWEIFQSFPHIRVVRPSYAYHCCQFMPSTYENLVNTIFIINIFAVVVEITLASLQLSLSKILQNYNPAHSVIRFPSTQTLVTCEKTSSSQGSSTSANSATRPCLASSGRHQVSWGWWWWWWRWWWYWWWLGWSVESTTNDLMITTRQLKHRTGHRSLDGPLGELCLRDVGGLPKYRRVRCQRWCQVQDCLAPPAWRRRWQMANWVPFQLFPTSRGHRLLPSSRSIFALQRPLWLVGHTAFFSSWEPSSWSSSSWSSLSQATNSFAQSFFISPKKLSYPTVLFATAGPSG